MPTATSTITTTAYPSPITLKAGLKPSIPVSSTPKPTSPTSNASTTSVTLRSLYSRAARAFLHRDIPLTHSLAESAFQLLKPPVLVHDALFEHRRKWDILRITLETTVYADPPPVADGFPETLRENLTESPQSLMISIYGRSLTLFTPTNGPSQKSIPNAAYLPSPVLITLLYSSLKIDSPDVGRIIVEDWLARREPHFLSNNSPSASEESEEAAYDKVLEIYCLHLLPKLEQWEYAKEFLQYESELPELRRQHFKSSLNTLHAQAIAARQPPKPLLSPSPAYSPSSSSSPRPYSPAPSSSSSSSSTLSTASTHTVVPATPRGNRSSTSPYGLTSLSQPSASSNSLSSDGTATPRAKLANLPNGNGVHRSRSKGRTANSSITSTSSGLSSVPRAHIQTSSVRPSSSNAYALIKASLAPYMTTSKTTTFFVLFVLFPLISWALRMRHRRQRLLANGGGGAVTTSNVELVRRRLQAAGSSEAGILSTMWTEVMRAVADTVRMAGSGLV